VTRPPSVDALARSLADIGLPHPLLVDAARAAIQQCGAQRVLVVSSGGPIGMLAKQVLEAPARTAIELNLQIRNSSFSHYFFNEQSIKLASFNNIPHLDRPDRLHAVSYG